VIRRLFFLLFLAAVVLAALFYWRHRESGPMRALREQFGNVQTTGEVKAALALNRELKGADIAVSAEDSVVTLRGDVSTEAQRRRAEEVAAAVPGVRQVVSHLRVSGRPVASPSEGRSIGESLDDKALEVQVRLALSLNRELEGVHVEVDVLRREVTLRGDVSSDAQRQAALRTARETPGVTRVIDGLRSTRVAAPSRIARAQAALSANRNLAPYALTVRESQGSLVLAGRVRTGAERDLAGLLVESAAGGPVQNQVRVGRE
jgi:hyperosmotically inducible protein